MYSTRQSRSRPTLILASLIVCSIVSNRSAFSISSSEPPDAVARIYAEAGSPDPGDPQALVRKLAALGETAVNDLIPYLSITRSDKGGPAAEALGTIGSKAVPALLEAMSSSPWAIRAGIARALAAINDPALDPVLSRLREETDPTVRYYLMSAVADMSSPTKYQYLEPFLTDSYWPVRAASVRMIGEGGDPSLLDRLLESLKDPDRDVRRRACTATATMIGRIQDRGESPPEKETPPRAIGVLRRPAPPEPEAAAETEGDPFEIYRTALEGALDDSYFGVRQAAADALVKLGGPSLDIFVARLDSENIGSVMLAARSAAAIDARAVLPSLANLLDHPDRFVRGLAAELLGESALAVARLPLTRALEEEKDETVRARLQEALARCEERNGPSLVGPRTGSR